MDLTVTLFMVLGVGLCLMMFSQGLSRRVDIFSIRNIYLAGFIVYQIISPALALHSESFAGFRIVNPARAGNWMLLFAYIFIAVFLLSYHYMTPARWAAGKISGGPSEASDSMLTSMAIALVIIALGARLIGNQVPILRAVGVNTSVALVAVSCATTGWIWAARRLNPAVLLVVALVVFVSLVVSLEGYYSRRPLISVGAGFAWGAYHRWAKNLSPAKLMLSVAPLIIIAGGIVSAYTAIRRPDSGTTEAQVTLQQMRGANFRKGTSDLLSGQAVGPAALWMFDAVPRSLPYNHAFSAKFVVYWWIPRILWENKPSPLSKDVANMAKIRGVNRDLITIPPGVLGYAQAEGGFYALILYAVFFGQFTRFFDQLIKLNPGNPYIVLPVGCATGQFLGLARGEISIFTNLAIIGFISTFLLILFTSIAFGRNRSNSLATALPSR